MQYYGDLGFGMFGWADHDIGIFGGVRSGAYQVAGQFRCRFTLYDTAHKKATGEDLQIGKLELIVSEPEREGEPREIMELINLEIDKPVRGRGYGRRVVEAVMRAAEDDIKVCSIKKTKLPFWKKMGVEELTTKSGQLNGTIRKEADFRNAASAGMSPSM